MSSQITEKRIKDVVHNYRVRGALILMLFLFAYIAADSYLVKNAVDKGLQVSPRGYTRGAIIAGLNVVYILACYVIEKALLDLFSITENTDIDHS